MSPDYGLYTFITSVLILLMQLHVVERANTLVKRSVVSEGGSQLSYLGLSRGRNVVERSGFMVYEDGEIPHPSYVKVAGPDEIPVEIDVLAELAKLRVAANTQREVLVAANRMPPETVISKMIAERTRAYMEEDAKAATVELPGGEPISPKSVDQPTKKPTSSVGVPGMGSMPTKSSPESPVSSLELLPGILMQTYPQSIGVILGVGAGQFVLTLLKGWSNTAGLYLVDPYIHIFRGYDDPANVDDKSHQLIFEHLRNQLVPYQSKFAFIRDFSYECTSNAWACPLCVSFKNLWQIRPTSSTQFCMG